MKQLLTFLFLCCSTLVSSQVVINIQLPQAGLCVKNQLWNLSLVSAFSETVFVQIEMVMTETSSGQRVLSGVSKPVALNKGAKLLQATDVMPITYYPGSVGYPVDANPDGFLPVGTFNVCYIVSRQNGEVAERLAEECETVQIEPISPPQLVMPADSGEVEVNRPLFTWLPPSPYHLFNNLVYDWVLVEVQPLQSGADAIQQNVPLLMRQNVNSTNFQYPLAAPALDTAKYYAWRVTAKSAVAPIANSEIWTFRLKDIIQDAVKRPEQRPYIKVKKEEDAAVGIAYGTVKYEYVNELNDSTILFSITDITGAAQKVIALDQTDQRIRFGQNLVELDLSKNRAMINKHFYLLQLIDSKRQKWYLKFEYRQPK